MGGYIGSMCGTALFKLIVGKAASASDQDAAAWLEKNGEVISSYAKCDVYNAN